MPLFLRIYLAIGLVVAIVVMIVSRKELLQTPPLTTYAVTVIMIAGWPFMLYDIAREVRRQGRES